MGAGGDISRNLLRVGGWAAPRFAREIEFALLAMLAGLFIVVAGIEKTALDEQLFATAQDFIWTACP